MGTACCEPEPGCVLVLLYVYLLNSVVNCEIRLTHIEAATDQGREEKITGIW